MQDTGLHLAYCVQFWSPMWSKNAFKLQWMPAKNNKMVTKCHCVRYHVI